MVLDRAHLVAPLGHLQGIPNLQGCGITAYEVLDLCQRAPEPVLVVPSGSIAPDHGRDLCLQSAAQLWMAPRRSARYIGCMDVEPGFLLHFSAYRCAIPLLRGTIERLVHDNNVLYGHTVDGTCPPVGWIVSSRWLG